MKKIAISLLVLALVAAFSATGVVSAATCAATTSTSATTTSAQCTSCTTAAVCCCPAPVTCCCPVVATCVVTKCCEVKVVKAAEPKGHMEGKEGKETAAVATKGSAAAAGADGTQASVTTQSNGAITQTNTQLVLGANNTTLFSTQSNTADPSNTNIPVNVVVKDVQINPNIIVDTSTTTTDNSINSSYNNVTVPATLPVTG